MTGQDDVVNSATVVGTDGSVSAMRALDWAADRVATQGGRLEILCVVDLAFGAALYGPRFDPVANASLILSRSEAAVRGRHPAVDLTTRWIDGRPAHELIRRSTDAALLVVGTDKTPGRAGPRIGTLPLTLAGKAGCPIAVIPDLGATERHDVVVGIHASAEAMSALALGVREARLADDDVIAVHAWSVPPFCDEISLPTSIRTLGSRGRTADRARRDPRARAD